MRKRPEAAAETEVARNLFDGLVYAPPQQLQRTRGHSSVAKQQHIRAGYAIAGT